MILSKILKKYKDSQIKSDNQGIVLSNKSMTNREENETKNIVKLKKEGDFLLWNMSDLEARDLCKHRIDMMERWSRRLIDEMFKEYYGNNYFEIEVYEGQPLIKSSIKRQVNGRMKAHPERFSRKVDALVIEDLEYLFCRNDLYKIHFKELFETFFSGQQEVRYVLKRMSSIRNKIAHGNHLSQHELEQGVCYSNDFVVVFSNYYKKLGKEKEYNVPTFLSVRDSFGHNLYRENSSYSWEIHDWQLANDISSVAGNVVVNALKKINLRSGDSYRLTLEVDDSFPIDFYEIEWYVRYGIRELIAKGQGNTVEFTVDDNCVSYILSIRVKLITKRTWHRFASMGCDDYFELVLGEVLPPLEK